VVCPKCNEMMKNKIVGEGTIFSKKYMYMDMLSLLKNGSKLNWSKSKKIKEVEKLAKFTL